MIFDTPINHSDFRYSYQYVMSLSQKDFVNLSSRSKVVVFTGKYENFLNIKSKCSDSLFLYFGSGINPTVVNDFPADWVTLIDKIAESRIFNSGQDCLCSNVIYVNRVIKEKFSGKLMEKIKEIKFGNRMNKNADITPIFYDNVLEPAIEYLDKYSSNVTLRGEIEYESSKLLPSVLEFDIENHPELYEFFAPLFVVIYYDNLESLEKVLFSDRYLRKAMGISLYSVPSEYVEKLSNYYTIAYNQSLFDIEDGNLPFGGYGEEASSVTYGGVTYNRPILISKEISEFIGSYNDIEIKKSQLIGV